MRFPHTRHGSSTPAPASDESTISTSGWIQTYSGHRVWPFAPKHPENVFDIADIAHALANVCRFGGHCRKFYSVAEHSVIGSFLATDDCALAFLMHDAAEAYIGDMTRPLKQSLFYGEPADDLFLPVKRQEQFLQDAILNWLNIPLPDHHVAAIVKDFDDQMLVKEAGELFVGGQRVEWEMHQRKGWIPADTKLFCWSPEVAEKNFMERYVELTCRGS